MPEPLTSVRPASVCAFDDAKPVAAAIMAAGLSRRMGTLNKLVQRIDGVPMVRRVAEQAVASRCARVLVVVGHRADEVREALAGLPVQFIENSQYREGLAASVRAAAQAVKPGEALMICLGDMPQVSTAIIDQLIVSYQGRNGSLSGSAGRLQDVAGDRHKSSKRYSGTAGNAGGCASNHHRPDENRVPSSAVAFQPLFDGRRGNPVLWAPGAVSLLRALNGDEGARSVLKRLGDAVMAVPVQSDGILMDIDTPEALREARRQDGSHVAGAIARKHD